MNNEIGRKITSLTLMTIMFAGSLTFAIPGVMPEAHAANANLFISSENSQFQNHIAGPMVTEVVINDPDIDETNEGKGEPDVKVNGKKLRMVQGTDGKWYAYFADRAQAQLADQIAFNSAFPGNSTDFGKFCNNAATLGGAGFTQTVGIAIARSDVGASSTDGQAAPGACAATVPTGPLLNNVVRENKTINPNFNNLGLASVSNLWPVIQLYDFNPTGNVVVTYNKGGNPQTTTLKFDTVDQFAKLDLDRTKYPLGSNVHATVTDVQLNIDPTDEDSWTFGTIAANATVFYQLFNENGDQSGDAFHFNSQHLVQNRTNLMFEDNGLLKLNTAAQAVTVVGLVDNGDQVLVGGSTAAISAASQPITLTEIGSNTGIFSNYDESDVSNIVALTGAGLRGKSAVIDYNDAGKSIVIGHDFATIDIQSPTGEWNSGEETPVTLVDGDANLNSRADEDLDLNNPNVALIPSLRTGTPFTLGASGATGVEALIFGTAPTVALGLPGNAPGMGSLTQVAGTHTTGTMTVDKFSDRGIITPNRTSYTMNGLVIDSKTTAATLFKSINNPAGAFKGVNMVNIDLRALNTTQIVDVYLLTAVAGADAILVPSVGPPAGGLTLGTVRAISLVNDTSVQSINLLNGSAFVNTNVFGGNITGTQGIGLFLKFDTPIVGNTGALMPIVADFFSFGFNNNGIKSTERVANQLVRLELEETGDNTSTFVGSLEFVMVNQLNILDPATYTGLSTIADDPTFIVIEDLTDEDSPRVNYFDKGADGVDTQIADQQAAPSHSGIVSFDKSSYKIADTVNITLEDQDLNTDVDTIEIYTTVGVADPALDAVGVAGLPTLSFGPLGRMLDVTFDDEIWTGGNGCVGPFNAGLFATGFTLIETGPATGKFTGDFQIPAQYCAAGGILKPATGKDIEVNYVDFRDASGEIIEVGDGAGVRANTGSVSLDRTVYPVPFGIPADFAGLPATVTSKNTPTGRSVFPIHQTGMSLPAGLGAGEFLSEGDLTVHIRVNDPDFDVSAAGEDTIGLDVAGLPGVGPVKITVIRGSQSVILGYAGGDPAFQDLTKPLDVEAKGPAATIRQFGPIQEIAPSAGIFEQDLVIRYTDGPADSKCPATTHYTLPDGSGTAAGAATRFDTPAAGANYCILQGDVLQVEYTDPEDASGDINTVTDSATFDLRNGVLQSDKSVYIIGSDMILTLIEPDLDLDNDQAETYNLDLIEWDSDAATCTMGATGIVKGCTASSFDPEPTDFRETGDSTGIFQIVIEIPQSLAGDKLERGEEIVLEYTDWGPSGADFVGDEEEDVNLTLFTSNFGATVELDQKVYTWTDKVYITIVAPDHNFDSNLVDDIGNSAEDPIKVATRGKKLTDYKLVETGTDTGIFTGEVILTGFCHDADGDSSTGSTGAPGTCPAGSDVGGTKTGGSGPTSGFLESTDSDGMTVSFEFSEDETVVGSALIRWNIGEVQWLEASYPAKGTGVVRVVDPDMNWNPEAVDNFSVDVWSDSDAGGIDLTVTETNEATGIFEGTVFFTVTDESSGHRLRVSEGDTITAEYEDNTLPSPYTRADELDITGTAIIGTIVPPLERAPATNARVVDAFGNSLASVSVDQQVQITADLANGQDRAQAFAYLVQVQDGNGVTVSLAWITGSLSPGQSFSPALSWIPNASGTYKATIFVWESVDNPTALSPPASVTITVK